MFTIIIPTYNAEKTITKTLSSLVSQTDSDFKVLLIDDQSNDNLLQKIEPFKQLLNLTYHRNEQNLGCGRSRGIGAELADTEYISFLDADDVLFPYTAALFNDAIKSLPEVDVFVSDFYQQKDLASFTMVEMPFTWCHGKLYKKKFLDDNNIKSNFVGTSEDAYFNAICLELGDCRKIPFPTMIWTQNFDSITHDPKRGYLEFFFSDYVRALRLAAEFVMDKGKIPSFIEKTTAYINYRLEREGPTFSEREKEKAREEIQLYNEMLERLKTFKTEE